MTLLAWTVWAVIALAGLTVLVLLAVMQRGQGPLAGAWVGRGVDGAVVYYDFRADGSGSRISRGTREAFRYWLIEGYPNRIVIREPSGGDNAVTYRGLVEIRSDGALRLALGSPNGPPPTRLGAGATELWRPPSR